MDRIKWPKHSQPCPTPRATQLESSIEPVLGEYTTGYEYENLVMQRLKSGEIVSSAPMREQEAA